MEVSVSQKVLDLPQEIPLVLLLCAVSVHSLQAVLVVWYLGRRGLFCPTASSRQRNIRRERIL